MSDSTQTAVEDVETETAVQGNDKKKSGDYGATDNHSPIAPEGESGQSVTDDDLSPMDNHSPIAPEAGKSE